MNRFVGGAVVALVLSGCGGDPGDVDDETDSLEAPVHLRAGVNGGACYLSDYNCKLRVSGGNRIKHKDGTNEWGVDPGAAVLDGNGDVLGIENGSSLRFNYGQKRVFGGKHYVYAMATSNHSSGWFPLASVKSGDVLSPRVGHASAHRAGLDKMHCYKVKNSTDPALEVKKIVYDTESPPGPAGEAAGDYLPRLRANGKRSINLIFNVPGSGLGGPAVDHFPAGTKFQRLDVPTDTGHPSIDVDMWLQDSKGRFRKPAGKMKYIYGYVISATGTPRVGWMAIDGLLPSDGCP